MSFLIPCITDVMRYFCCLTYFTQYDNLYVHPFSAVSFYSSVSLFCFQHHLSRGKAKPFLAAICRPVAQPAPHCCCLCGLIPAFPPSVPPVCFLTRSSLLMLQVVPSSSSCMIHSLIFKVILKNTWRCLKVSQGTDFPVSWALISKHTALCSFPHGPLSSPPLPFPPEHFFPWGHCLSLPLRRWRAAGERELCCVLLHPQD